MDSKEKLTENDKRLIAQARATHYTEWYLLYNLEKKADTEEARSIIHGIANMLYHKEEAAAGLL